MAATLTGITATGDSSPAGLTADVVRLAGKADSAIADGEWAEARSLLTEAIGLRPGDPGNVLLMSNLGIVKHQLGDDDGAIETLTQANIIAPASVTVLNNRARVYLSMGRKDDAVADYRRVTELDSTVAEPYFYLGMVDFSRGDIKSAKAHFDKLARLAPNDETTLLAQATIHTATGEAADAINDYQRLIAKSPDAEYYSGLIENRLALDQLSDAASDIAEAMKRYPADPEFYILRAVLNKRLYLLDEARADAKRAVALGADARQVNLILNSR